jgi:hypothetical protein
VCKSRKQIPTERDTAHNVSTGGAPPSRNLCAVKRQQVLDEDSGVLRTARLQSRCRFLLGSLAAGFALPIWIEQLESEFLPV